MSGSRGPKSLPANVHLLNGNRSKLPVQGLLQKLQRPNGLPECPDFLKGDARAEWERLGALLESLGLISELDLAAFALYCGAWADYKMASEKLNEKGAEGYVEQTPSGYRQMSVWYQIKNRAADAVNKYKAEFGLSPADWNRVDASPQGDLFGSPGLTAGSEKTPESFLR